MIALFAIEKPDLSKVLSVHYDSNEDKLYTFVQTTANFVTSLNSNYWDKATALTAGTSESNTIAAYFYSWVIVGSGKTQLDYLQKSNFTDSKGTRITFILTVSPVLFPYVKVIYNVDTSFCDLLIGTLDIGQTTLIVNANTSKPPIQYSLDNINFQLNNNFSGLIPNTQYTIYCKDSGGCKDFQSFKTLETVPTYGIKYHLDYLDRNNNRTDIDILEQNFEGVPFEFTMAQDGLSIGMHGNNIIEDCVKGTYCIITNYSLTDYKFLDLFIENPLQYYVRIKKQNELFWAGLIEPETYTESYKPVPYDVQINANDGLAYLKEVSFLGKDGNILQGRHSLLDVIVLCFSHLPYDFKLCFAWNTYEVSFDTDVTPFAQTYVNALNFEGLNCYDVLYRIANSTLCQLNYWFGAFHFTEKKQPNPYTVRVYSKQGTFLREYDFDPITNLIPPDNNKTDRWLNMDGRLSMIPAAKSFTNTVEMNPQNDIISGFKTMDFEQIGDKNPTIGAVQYPIVNYVIQLGFNNSANIGSFENKSYLDSINLAGSYLKPSILRDWNGNTDYYFVNQNDKVGIKLVAESNPNFPKSIFKSTDFLFADPKFDNLVSGQKFPHKIKIEFSYILETSDEQDNDKYYEFRYALNINGQTQFFSIENEKFTTNINQFQTVKATEINKRVSYSLELSLLPLYTYTNGVPSMQTSKLFLRLEVPRGSTWIKREEYAVSSISFFDVSVSILPYGSQYPNKLPITLQNPLSKHWRSKIDFVSYLFDVEKNYPNSRFAFLGAMYKENGLPTEKWNSHFAKNKPLQTLNTQNVFEWYKKPKQQITGSMLGQIGFLSVIVDPTNFNKAFICSGGEISDYTQQRSMNWIEYDSVQCSKVFTLKQEFCCKKIFRLVQEFCFVAPIITNPNVSFSVEAFQNIQGFGDSNFANSGGAGVTIYQFSLNPSGGVLAFDFDPYYQCDKIEIYHNSVQKSTSNMANTLAGLTTFSPVTYSNSDYGLDTNGRNGGSWYIGEAKGIVPNRVALFQSDTSFNIAPTFDSTEDWQKSWQRIWWKYTAADVTTNGLAQLVITGTNGTAWEVTKLVIPNEPFNNKNIVSFQFTTLSATTTETINNSGSFTRTLKKDTVITLSVLEKSSPFVRYETDTGGGTFVPNATTENATIIANGTFNSVKAIFQTRNI